MNQIKTVNDDPDFVRCNDAVLKCQAEMLKVAERSSAIESEILGIREIVPADDQWNRFQAGSTIDSGARSRIDALRAEQSDLQAREGFLNEALEQGRTELDQIRSKLSLQVCKAHRNAFVEDARRILNHLKLLCAAIETSRARRENLERDGIQTGSIPYLLFDLDPWDDQFGGKVAAYRQWIKANFPEVS